MGPAGVRVGAGRWQTPAHGFRALPPPVLLLRECARRLSLAFLLVLVFACVDPAGALASVGGMPFAGAPGRDDVGSESQELVLATWNPQKLRELAEVTRILHVKTMSAGQLGLEHPSTPSAPSTMEEDAENKAQAVARAARRAALADCSVLCVAALDNAPGLDADQLVQEGGGWEGAMDVLHERIMSVPVALGKTVDMRATYHCTMTLALPDGQKVTVSDTLNGKLVWPPRGDVTHGSGFYSMFVAEGEAQTLQEMNIGAFEAMANSNHRFGAFEETVKSMFRAGMAGARIGYNPFKAFREKQKAAGSPEALTPLQDIFEYVRPPGVDIVNNEYIKPYMSHDSRHILYPQLPPEDDLEWQLDNDPDVVIEDCQRMMGTSAELHAQAERAAAAGRDSVALEAQAMDMANNAVYLAGRVQVDPLEATALVNLATLLGASTKALQVLDKAMAVAERHEDMVLVCVVLGKRAAVLLTLGDVDAALGCLEQARKIAVAQDLVEVLALVYASYSSMLMLHGEDDKAMTYGHETMRLAKDIGDLELVIKASSLLHELYAKRGQEIEAHEARGVGLEAAAEVAARTSDVDAMLAADKALDQWRQQSSIRVPVSLTPPADRDMLDSPLRSPTRLRASAGAESRRHATSSGQMQARGNPDEGAR